MRKLFRRQSELSAASAVFYFFGAVISALALTVFYDETNPLNGASLVVGALALAIAIAFFVAGDRAPLGPAILLMCVTGTLVLILVALSRFEIRSMGSGLLFYTFFIYLAWFGRMWLARIAGYSWLVGYCIVMAIKFGADIMQYITTLILTAVILGELVGTYKRRLEVASITDPLCGIWNKRGFDELIARTLQIVRRTGQPLSVLYFDLDDFKRINDVHGHREGDRVLREFAAQLEANTRPQDTLARLGGDEFILVLPGTVAAQAETLVARLRERVTVAPWSCGWAEMAPGDIIEDVVARADEMLLEHKRERVTTESSSQRLRARID